MERPKWKSEVSLATDEDDQSSEVKAAPLKSHIVTNPRKMLGRSASLSSLNTTRLTEEMRQHIAQLKIDLDTERNVAKQLKRDKVLDVKLARENEAQKHQNMLQEMERSLRKEYKKEFDQEINKSQKDFDREMQKVVKSKDRKIKLEREKWQREKESLMLQIEHADHYATQNSALEFEKVKEKLENDIIFLQEEKAYLNEELKLFRDSDRNQANENRRVYEEHQADIEKLRKDALQDSKKQLAEMKQLQGVIEQLEKKLGFEAGTCLRLQMEKDTLDDALSRLKQADSWEKRSLGKGRDCKGVEFDLEGLIMEMPARLASKPHNDPERILHRKYIELSSLVRRLDEKNQQLALRNEELLEEINTVKTECKPLEEKVVQQGIKNMDLTQAIRKNENRIKDLQQDAMTKDDKIVRLQELVERKDKKIKKTRKKEMSQVQMDDYEDLQRQLCEQLQIIAELRQQTVEKDRRIDVLKKRQIVERKFQESKKKSLSLDSLTADGHDGFQQEFEDIRSEDGELLFEDLQSSIDDNNENKRRLAKLTKENLELQHAYALLQGQSYETKDPERAEMQREALQSDLLVSQATINELERQLEGKDEEHTAALGEYQNMKEGLEEKNKDLHQKLISAESDLVQKTLQLKDLTEDMKELMDQNDLMEFQMAELEQAPKLRRKSDTPVKLTEEDREDLTMDIEDVDCDAISVRIALKELEINKEDEFTPLQKRTLVQARALVNNGVEEITSLQNNAKLLRERIKSMETKYSDVKLQLREQEEELSLLRRDKMKFEEHELLFIGDLTTLGKKRKRSFDLMFGFEKSPAELLAEAKSKISELEHTNEILLNKVSRVDGSKVDLSEEEIALLRHKMDQLRDAEKQINILKASNDDLLRRIKRFEKNEVKLKSGSFLEDASLPEGLAEEISKLKRENEELNGELGTLRLRADDALVIAQKTKEVLNRDDQATQTPSFEILEPVPKRVLTDLTDASIQTKVPTPDLDPNVIERAVVEEMMSEIFIKDVECQPYEFIPYESSGEMSDEQTCTYHETDMLFKENTGSRKDELLIPDENQLHADNEFIQSILREYDVNTPPYEGEPHNESVIYRPTDRLQEEVIIFEPINELHLAPSEPITEADANPFDVYLNETTQNETPRSSDGPLFNLSSDRSIKSSKNSRGINGELLTPRSSVNDAQYHESPASLHSSNRRCSECSTGSKNGHTHESELWSSLNVDNEKPLFVDTHGRISSGCSSCGLTPPYRRNIPQDILQQLQNYSSSKSRSESASSSTSITPRAIEGRVVSHAYGEGAGPNTELYPSGCSTCGLTPPHSARKSQSQSSDVQESLTSSSTTPKPNDTQSSITEERPPPSMIPIRISSNRQGPKSRPSRPVYPESTPEKEHEDFKEKNDMEALRSEAQELVRRTLLGTSPTNLRSDSASPPYNIRHKPPPYIVASSKTISCKTLNKQALVSNLQEISEDVLRVINQSKKEEERAHSVDVEEQRSDTSLSNVDADVQELLDYGKTLREFECEEFKDDDDEKLYLGKKDNEKFSFKRLRSYSDPNVRYSSSPAGFDRSKTQESLYSDKSLTQESSSTHNTFTSTKYPSKFDSSVVDRLDSGIESVPRESEIDTTYEGRYSPYKQVDLSNYSEDPGIRQSGDHVGIHDCHVDNRNPLQGTGSPDCRASHMSFSPLADASIDICSCPGHIHDIKEHKHSHSFRWDSSGSPSGLDTGARIQESDQHLPFQRGAETSLDKQGCQERFTTSAQRNNDDSRYVSYDDYRDGGDYRNDRKEITACKYPDHHSIARTDTQAHPMERQLPQPTVRFSQDCGTHGQQLEDLSYVLPAEEPNNFVHESVSSDMLADSCQVNDAIEEDVSIEFDHLKSDGVENYFSTYRSQENVHIRDTYKEMLKDRPKPPGRTRRSYSCSPSRPIRSRSHSPMRQRYFNTYDLSSRQHQLPAKPCNSNFHSSRYKFPSDSELSRKSDSDSEFPHLPKSFSESKLPNPPRKLPFPKCITYNNGSKKIPPTLPKPIISNYKNKRERLGQLIDQTGDLVTFRKRSIDRTNDSFVGREEIRDHVGMRKEINFLHEQCASLKRQLQNKEAVLQNMHVELKDEAENVAIIEKKDKEIQLKSESIATITHMLQKTRKELELRIFECDRRENEIKQLKIELKNVTNEKKKVECSHSEQQVTISKLETTETRLQHMSAKCDDLVADNRELVERMKTLEISEKEFIDLERNVIDLQTQLCDMEDIEVHRDELIQKLQHVKKQRDDFLEKGKLVEEERNEFVRSNKTLEQYIVEWRRKTAEFKRVNQALKDRILSLEKDKKELESRVVEIQQERTVMQTKISKIEMERDDYIRELREITLERNTLEARLDDFEDLLSDHDQLEEGFHSLRLKVAELTRQRDDAELLIPSYKAKVQLFKKTIHEKEDSIMQLTHDIKTMKVAIENSTFEDVSKLKSLGYISPDSTRPHHHHSGKTIKSYFSEKEPDLSPKRPHREIIDLTSGSDSYDMVAVRPRYDTYSDESIVDERYIRKRRSDRHSRHNARKYVALFDYDPYKSSTSEHPERELRLKEGDYVTVYGEMDIDGFLDAEVDGVQGLVPSMYVEEHSDDGRSEVYHRDHQHSGEEIRSSNQRERKFVVLYDYDPFTMGTTDRPDLQLSLRKGDVIIVYGDVDVDGYYTAILNGKRGLVPSNFIEEYSYHSRQGHSHSAHREDYHGGQHSKFQGTIEVEDVTGPPYAPRDLKVNRVVTRNAVLLGWQLPPMDEYGRSNGCRVTGYRVWVNGKMKQNLSSATMAKALIDDVDLHGRVEFSIQTVGENEFCSEKCHFAITGALSALSKDSEVAESGSNTYVALYDYDPFKSSPNPNPSLELAFREGDLMKVQDTSRSDGFYEAELNGKQGLVPSNFIERVRGGRSGGSSSHHHHNSSSSHQPSAHHDFDSNSRRVQFQQKEK